MAEQKSGHEVQFSGLSLPGFSHYYVCDINPQISKNKRGLEQNLPQAILGVNLRNLRIVVSVTPKSQCLRG